ncbi:hypothetical protein [Nonomuraea ceibae]|uniref:hypothetical protein n=1 Tax=Nonomuraea ceibae TaxID=1935170 RepID=UPI001C5D2DAF|nr:hypothetical protein [Nonomuraea ceibae]
MWLHYGDDDILNEAQKAALDNLAARLDAHAPAHDEAEEIEPGYVALKVTFDFEETCVFGAATRIIVPNEPADDPGEVRQVLRGNMDWYEEIDHSDFSAPDDDCEDPMSNLRIVKEAMA